MDWLWRSHRVGTLFGIEVRLAYSLYIFLALFALPPLLAGAGVIGLLSALAVLLLPVCVLLHELGHSLVALAKGVPVRRIVLTMIGGAADLGGTIPGPRAELYIALAGPLVSLALGLILYVPATLGGLTGMPLMATFFGHLAFINLILAVFNMLPVFPMDGGRVAAALAVMTMGTVRGLEVLRKISRVGAIGLGALGAFLLFSGSSGGLFLILIAFFLHANGQQELQARLYVARYAEYGGYSPQASFLRQLQQVLRQHFAPRARPVWVETPHASHADAGPQVAWAYDPARDALNARVDAILDKVRVFGLNSLTPEERDALNRASMAYRGHM